ERAGPCSKPWSTGRITMRPVPPRRPWFSMRARLVSVPGLSLPYQLSISRTRSFMLPPSLDRSESRSRSRSTAARTARRRSPDARSARARATRRSPRALAPPPRPSAGRRGRARPRSARSAVDPRRVRRRRRRRAPPWRSARSARAGTRPRAERRSCVVPCGCGQPERGELVEHVGAVRGGPVRAPAARAALEVLLGGEDVGRHVRRRLLAGDVLERTVAVEAAAEKVAAEPDGARHLPELLAEVVAGHEEARRELRMARQARVPREQETALPPGAIDQGAPAQVRPVGHVVPEDAQPARQPAEHLVDRESWTRLRRRLRSGPGAPLYGVP